AGKTRPRDHGSRVGGADGPLHRHAGAGGRRRGAPPRHRQHLAAGAHRRRTRPCRGGRPEPRPPGGTGGGGGRGRRPPPPRRPPPEPATQQEQLRSYDEQLKGYAEKVRDVEAQLASLREFERKVRIIANLPAATSGAPGDSARRGLGGGADDPTLATPPIGAPTGTNLRRPEATAPGGQAR